MRSSSCLAMVAETRWDTRMSCARACDAAGARACVQTLGEDPMQCQEAVCIYELCMQS